MTETYIGIGSNLGDRSGYITRALTLMSKKLDIKAISSPYETEPEGYREQPDFLNTVVKAETGMSARDLLKFLKSIEEKLGRRPSFPNAPREIDLDILFFGDSVIEQLDLFIPHPRLHTRAFMLVPLMELNPELAHPALHKTVKELLDELGFRSRVRKAGRIVFKKVGESYVYDFG
ncbi:MAG: 2-amino-4-hydroxy-6-hydroxymethyldihydropteridine diphosphokinase [Dehalococcoidia bacterium]|nr:2-amino-4-hydroxy-6-hydroxymethyldihydropteridine diphosphokinase [Dehalococcoidia bacterium]